jgi:general secretion pathway protein J
MTLMKKTRHEQGFTLLEIIIAMAIFSMISLASFSIFDTVIKSDETSKAHADRLYKLQRSFMIIERDVIQIAKRTVRIEGEAPLSGYLHTDQSALSSDTEIVGFVRSGWRNPGLLLPRGDMQSVAYRLQDNNLERLHYNFVDAVVGQKPIVRKLIDHVNELKFEFYYSDKWQEEAPKNALPAAIAIELDVEDFGRVRREFLVAGSGEVKQEKTRAKS